MSVNISELTDFTVRGFFFEFVSWFRDVDNKSTSSAILRFEMQLPLIFLLILSPSLSLSTSADQQIEALT